MLGVGALGVGGCSLLRLSRNIGNIGNGGRGSGGKEEGAVGAVAASLEAADDAAEVFLHFLFDKEDAMQMVGHHLQGDDFDFGVITGYAQPFLLHSCAQLA